jgi:hypothetical protein
MQTAWNRIKDPHTQKKDVYKDGRFKNFKK